MRRKKQWQSKRKMHTYIKIESNDKRKKHTESGMKMKKKLKRARNTALYEIKNSYKFLCPFPPYK